MGAVPGSGHRPKYVRSPKSFIIHLLTSMGEEIETRPGVQILCPDLIERSQGSANLMPIELAILDQFASSRHDSYQSVAEEINERVGAAILSRIDIASWVSFQRGRLMPPGPLDGQEARRLYDILRLKNERYLAGRLLRQIKSGEAVNRKTLFFQVFSQALSTQYLSTEPLDEPPRRVPPQSSLLWGTTRRAALRLGIKTPQYLTTVLTILRDELVRLDSPAAADYLQVVQEVGRQKLSEPRLGKTAEADQRLRVVANQMAEAASIDDINAVTIPNP